MRRWIRYGLIALAIVFVTLVGAVVGFALRYRSLAAESEPGVVLAPDRSDVVYCTMDGEPQKLDLYLPKDGDSGRAPALVYIHGGSWTGGDKAKGNGLAEIPELVSRGYLVASVNYRLAPEHRFPAPIEDVKGAIRYLRANADSYDLDPDRLGVWGGSAGGHLALLVGLTDASAGFDRGEYLEYPSSVVAVVDMFGPADLTATDITLLQKSLLHRAFDTTSPEDPRLARASPVNYITEKAPPILILHGVFDDAVPASQSRMLHERLQAAGVPSRLVMVENANHNFAPTAGPISPSRQEITRIVADFFDHYLER